MNFVIEAAGLSEGGGRELAYNLFSRLSRFREHRFVMFVSRRPEYRALRAPNVEWSFYEGGSGLVSRLIALERTLPGICAARRADALLCLGNFAPRTAPCATAVLIQNANLLWREAGAQRRRTWREKLILAYGRRAMRRLPRYAHVIVQSPRVRQRLPSMCGLAPRRISVIPCPSSLGAEAAPYVQPKPAGNPFTFLCLARYYAHKNLEILPKAVQLLAARTSLPFRCLLTISRDQHPGARKLLDRIEAGALSNVVRNIGPVDREKRAEVYRIADAVILPSLLESYSASYSEAMRFGLPILTSRRDFGQELCGTAAEYFDPLDPEDVARGMFKVLTDASLRRELSLRGRRIVAQLPDWEDIAAQFVDVLEQAASGASRKSGRIANRESVIPA